MIAFAYGVSALGDLKSAGWVHGLKLAAVAVVAQAVIVMWQKLCPDRPRMTIALAGAALLFIVPGAWSQVGVIGAGALFGWAVFRAQPTPPASNDLPHPRRCQGRDGLREGGHPAFRRAPGHTGRRS